LVKTLVAFTFSNLIFAGSELGQIRWLPQGDVIGQRRFIHTLFGIAA